MAPGFCTTQQSSYINSLADIPRKQDKLAGTPKRSDANSNEALTLPEAPTLLLVPPPANDFFTKFMKVFMKTTQVRDQEQLEPQERPLKARTLETYSRKSHMDYYHFC